MLWNSGTVFILGAGFTKAFLPSAPLLVGDYDARSLLEMFEKFPEAHALLEMEIRLTEQEGYESGWINLERLMTRLVGGMPYDYRNDSKHSFAELLSKLKKTFKHKLDKARADVSELPAELWFFARHCLQCRIHCITFNYDDVLDEALSNCHQYYGLGNAWNPDFGYGFPCRTSESLVSQIGFGAITSSAMNLIKLHGSVNWRVPFGISKPYGPEVIRHHESWFRVSGLYESISDYERLLESDPLTVPPLLSKSDLVAQPVLRLTWSLAIDALRQANRVVFMGYSLPITDIAAGFLFREGLSHLEQTKAITVVDYARNDAEKTEKKTRLSAAYQKVFPGMTEGQLEFCGANKWIRDNLTQWLFNSKGAPVAYRVPGHVFSINGSYIGQYRGYVDHNDYWDGTYQGEIIQDNRFVCADPKPLDHRAKAYMPPKFTAPRLPDNIASIELPAGFRDFEI